MTIIDDLITDRSAADAAEYRALAAIEYEDMTGEQKARWDTDLRGGYNDSDMNRVGQAVAYVTALLAAAGYSVSTSPKTDWTEYDAPTPAQLSAYLANIEELRRAITVPPSTPTTPAHIRTTTEANNIEQILQRVTDTLERIQASLWYCGMPYCGMVWTAFM